MTTRHIIYWKLFKTNDINIVKHCQREFNFNVPIDILAKRCKRFEVQYRLCDNVFCKFLSKFMSLHQLRSS